MNGHPSQKSLDVIILGGTPGGISAAIAAARLGRTVAIIEYHDHIGGMTASGLGKSDIENREMIGGIFHEFTERVRQHYVEQYGDDSDNVELCRDGYYSEPSVAEAIFEQMLGEQPGITVMKGWRLQSASLKEDRLTAIEIMNRRTGEASAMQGEVFVDATYEGDLYAAAGAEYRLGRESREQFGEPHAGVVYFDYQSGRFLPGTTGEADERLPACTYRLCLTTDPDNSFALGEAPPDYARENYIGYFDDLAAGRLGGPKVLKPGRGYNPAHFDTLVRALSVTDIPNNKTDVNINPRPLAFPFPEENRGYVEGDDAARQSICERHRHLTLGLLWFLQNDEQIPSEHRAIARRYHLPLDEFADNGHFPFQLYVREARRLVGECTLTEQDITRDGEDGGPRQHHDTIAIGEFPIDSFPCSKRQPGDTVVLEGYLGMLDAITRPYEIPYRIMLPTRIDGLLVPVAASTTHVAYSSIRMEPTWMALGQAAGTAAHLALKHDAVPRRVPIAGLRQLLFEHGQVLKHSGDQMMKSGISKHKVAVGSALAVGLACSAPAAGEHPDAPHPVKNPDSSLMLDLPGIGRKPNKISFNKLPRMPAEHAVISDVRDRGGKWVHQHAYLVHHGGRYWAMWSDGPGVPQVPAARHRNRVPGHDRPDTRVSYATSKDGLEWSKVGDMSGPPRTKGFGWISRGFWKRDGELLALASHFNAPGYPGKGLSLESFRWDNTADKWIAHGTVRDDSMNNFPPKMLPSGKWMMSRRDHRRQVSVMVGGVEAFNQWEIRPLANYEGKQQPEEPYWYVLPDGENLVGLLRDNGGSKRLLRVFSTDNGTTWSKMVTTNFPDATSKFFTLRTSRGYYAMVSNSNPRRRDPLTLAISPDGLVYTRLFYLVGGRHIDYPHMIEHDGHLMIIFSGAKQTVEVRKVSLKTIDELIAKPNP